MRHAKIIGLLIILMAVGSVHALELENDNGHWAFNKAPRPPVPDQSTLRHASRVRNPVDSFILKRLQEADLEPAPETDLITLVRRAYFDLLGMPPSPEQVDAFLADTSDDAWPKLIEELLASKHYGERWGRHWLDVARYADSGGYETDIYYRNAWRYRDYVVDSFNEDKSYQQFVQEQIAGDELWPDNLDLDPRRVYQVSDAKRRHQAAHIATGFYALGPRVHESGLDAKRLSYETKTDWVDTTASAFMGLTLGCARCHDHKFDPFTQVDYFALQAIFSSAKEMELPLWTSMEEADWRQSYPRVIAVQEARKAFQQFDEQTKGKPLSEEQLVEKTRLLSAIGEAVLRLPERAAGQFAVEYAGLMHPPVANVLGREHPSLIKPVHLLERGELHLPAQQISAGLPKKLAQITETSSELSPLFESRKQFALWLTRPDHPLTARVIVNRIWQWHFGRGIVSTPNDFGEMGEPPSHPELLDWLAREFISGDWRIKSLHRLIMVSSTYRMTSRFGRQKHLDRDPENKLLWRMNRRRLEAEALWDAVHTASGRINLTMGGRPVVPVLDADEMAALREKWHWTVSANQGQHTRRGLYILVRRNFRFPMFEVFDAPVTSVSCPSRDVTTVAPQALWSLNNKSVFQQAMYLVDRVVKEVGQDPESQIVQAWKIVLGRAPSQEERRSAKRLINTLEQQSSEPMLEHAPTSIEGVSPERVQALSKLCLTLFNLSEFAFVD